MVNQTDFLNYKNRSYVVTDDRCDCYNDVLDAIDIKNNKIVVVNTTNGLVSQINCKAFLTLLKCKAIKPLDLQ